MDEETTMFARTMVLLTLISTIGACRGRPGSNSADCDAGRTTPPPRDSGGAIDRPAVDGIDTYLDDLSAHPGCSTAGLSYEPAQIEGYQCAARAWDTSGENEDLPIVLLVHGNSDGPDCWEAFESTTCDPRGATQGQPMLAERLVEAGYRVYAVDFRKDLVDDCADDNTTCNAAKNMDHGWSVPIAQHFVRSVIEAHPGRQISLIGHSFGVTTIRDALRRLWTNEEFSVWEHVDDVILLAGGNHGVSSFPLCSTNMTRRGRVTCEMGNRAAYRPTAFTDPLNGPDGEWETPCADGDTAFGAAGACSGHTVEYLTIVMQDTEEGTQQDQFVSEASSRLEGATNLTIGLGDFDQSDYFFCGLFKDHYGPARTQAAIDMVLEHLGD
jgi:pimeloyl-ACP methyl ester carboxylesterase